MKNRISQWIPAGWFLLLAGVLSPVAQESEMDFELTRIDSGKASVSPYWGYNAPKLVFDGEHYYTLGRWGPRQDAARGVVYRSAEAGWESFLELQGLHHQPGMVLLDSQRRLVVIHARRDAGPRILHQRRHGDPRGFAPIALPDGLDRAGYIGAAMDGDRLVLGFIGRPGTYSFQTAWVDLDSGSWSGPYVLAQEQRTKEPWTTWLYPLIVPDGDGFHLVVSNNAYRSSYYNRINYLFVRYEDPASAVAEVVADVNPWKQNLAFAQAVCRAADGALLVTAVRRPQGGRHQLLVYRRDPGTRRWDAATVGNAGVAAVFENPNESGQLWMSSTSGPALRLYRGEDGGRSWAAVVLKRLEGFGLRSTFFLYGITPASGSLLPDEPCAVFSSGTLPETELWFVRFRTRDQRPR
ncbi:MAG: hypothetical protein OXU79_17125 [Gemmatimonadota bacterium]|nr:hypothetical protein [Gemmatimonadota bacterium]